MDDDHAGGRAATTHAATATTHAAAAATCAAPTATTSTANHHHGHHHGHHQHKPAKTYHVDVCGETTPCARCFFASRTISVGHLRWTTHDDANAVTRSYHLACVSQEMCQEMMIAHSGGERGLCGRRVDGLRFIDYWQCVSQIRGICALDGALKHGVGFYLARLARGCKKGISRHMLWVAPISSEIDQWRLRKALRMAGPKSSLELVFNNELASWERMMSYEDERRLKEQARARAKALRIEVKHLGLSEALEVSPGPLSPTTPGTPGSMKRPRNSCSDESSQPRVQWR